MKGKSVGRAVCWTVGLSLKYLNAKFSKIDVRFYHI